MVMIGLNATCYIMKQSTAKNDYGEDIESFTTGTTGAACRFIQASAAERERVSLVLGGEFEVATHKVLFTGGADVETWDRLLTGTDYYKVLSVVDVDFVGHHLEVWTAKLEGVT